MDTETPTNPVEGEDTGAPTLADNAEVDTEGQVTEPELDEDGNPVIPEPIDDSEEVEHDGQKYKVPKALVPQLMMQADYTRKTQAIAEERKALEAERATVRQTSEAEIGARAQLASIDQQLTQYGQIDWNRWNQEDPFAASAAFMEYQQMKDARGNAVGQLSQLQQQRVAQEQQETAKRIEQGREVLARDIQGWSPQLAEALLDTGVKQYGFERGEIEEFSDPRMVKVLHDAHQWRQSQAKQQKAQAHVAAQTAKPATQVAAKSAPPVGLDDRLSADEWLKRRNSQVQKRA